MIDFHIRPHANAPLFAAADGHAVLRQLIDERLSHPTDLNAKDVREYMRQAGFVNLWFFLKYIAGAAGPYDFLNDGVHLDLCNFRQSDDCMLPGSRVCIVEPRGFAKTTISTHGGDTWECLRDPDLRIRIVNATVARAHDFKHTAQRTFDSNPLFAWLYPEAVPGPAAKRWNAIEMVMPHATRMYKEPTIAAGGSSGASEGDHHDLISGDDLIGLDDVGDDFMPRVNMKVVSQWMDVNLRALLISPTYSRVILAFTRYGPGDVYQPLFDDCKKVMGYTAELENLGATIDPKNTWTIYYRHVVEHGIATNPFVMTREAFEHLLKTKPLTAAYQYANNVRMSINNEFGNGQTKSVHLEPVDDAASDYRLIREDEENPEKWALLSECATCISVDWAGTHRNVNARTSRSSIGCWALDVHGRYYRFDQQVGYFEITKVMNAVFDLNKKYEGFIERTLLETNAQQSWIVDQMRKEQTKRGVFINIREAPARGDKIVFIRSQLGNPLYNGMVYLVQGCSKEFTEERLMFPSSIRGHFDVLDESAKAFLHLKKPMDQEFIDEMNFRNTEAELEVDNQVFGY